MDLLAHLAPVFRFDPDPGLDSNEFARSVDARLGVDALEITADQLREKLVSSSRHIKVALLDQTAVWAGSG